MPLTLEADGSNALIRLIDGAFANNSDMQSHTGGALSLGKGVVYGLSTRLIENAQSDTFKAPCCCFENAPNTAPTIVYTINVSIDCNWFDVPNLPQKKHILK